MAGAAKDVDAWIERLRGGEKLTEESVKELTAKCREILVKESNVQVSNAFHLLQGLCYGLAWRILERKGQA